MGCAYMTGRAYALVRKRQVTQFRFFGWVFRTVLCIVAVALRHDVDIAEIGFGVLFVTAFVLGFWNNMRVKKEEDLTRTMFPE